MNKLEKYKHLISLYETMLYGTPVQRGIRDSIMSDYLFCWDVQIKEIQRVRLQIDLPELTDAQKIKQISHIVCKVFEIEKEDLLQTGYCSHVLKLKKRGKRGGNVIARFTIMYLIRKYTAMTYQQISEVFGYCNHTTAFKGILTIENALAYDKQYIEKFNSIESELLK